MQSRCRYATNALLLCTFVGIATVQAETISQIYKLALDNDAQLKAAQATFRADSENETIARAALLPQISAGASYVDSTNEEESSRVFELAGQRVPSSSNDETDSEQTTYSLKLNQAIFDLPAWFEFQRGRTLSKQAQASLSAEQQDLIVRVAQTYFDVLKARSNLEASRAEERATRRQLEQTQQRFDVGLIAITDVHEARASYDQTKVQRLIEEGRVATSLENLGVLTNQSHRKLHRLTDNFKVSKPVPLDRNAWVEFALKNNHRLQAARYTEQASQKASRGARAGHLPTISGQFSYNQSESDGSSEPVSGGGDPKPFSTDSEGSSITINLNVPIFSGGGTSARRRQAYARYDAAKYQHINTRRKTVNATRAQHIAVMTDVERVKARKQAIISTRSALDATRAGYQVGTRNVVDVLNAQRALYASIRDYNNARHDYIVNMLQLKQQAGTLSPQDIFDLDKWLTDATKDKLD